MNIIEFIESPELINDQNLSVAQRMALKAVYGLELSQEELEAIPILTVLDSIPFTSYYAMLRRDGEDALAYFRNHVETMSIMWAEMQRISAIFAKR